MRFGEVIAVGASTALMTGGFAAGAQFKKEADARARAATAQACETYDSNGQTTKDTVSCLSQPWVNEGETVDTANINAGEPQQLLQGYVEIQKNDGSHFDAEGTLILAALGFAGGLLFGPTVVRGVRKF